MVSLENERRRGPYGFGPIVLVFSATVTGANAPDGGAEGFVRYFAGYPILAGARRMKYQDIITAEAERSSAKQSVVRRRLKLILF